MFRVKQVASFSIVMTLPRAPHSLSNNQPCSDCFIALNQLQIMYNCVFRICGVRVYLGVLCLVSLICLDLVFPPPRSFVAFSSALGLISWRGNLPLPSRKNAAVCVQNAPFVGGAGGILIGSRLSPGRQSGKRALIISV